MIKLSISMLYDYGMVISAYGISVWKSGPVRFFDAQGL